LCFRIYVRVSILSTRVAEKWWRVGILINYLQDDGIAICVNMLVFIFCLPGAIVDEDHRVNQNIILFICCLGKLLPALI
jgi:hypothetical protein